MALQVKSLGKHRRQSAGTPVYLKHPVALQTSKMMVMMLSGKFVPRRFTRKLNRGQIPRFRHRLHGAIDGCDAKIRDFPPSVLKHLLWTQRTVRLFQNAINRPALVRISLHIPPFSFAPVTLSSLR